MLVNRCTISSPLSVIQILSDPYISRHSQIWQSRSQQSIRLIKVLNIHKSNHSLLIISAKTFSFISTRCLSAFLVFHALIRILKKYFLCFIQFCCNCALIKVFLILPVDEMKRFFVLVQGI